MARHAEQVLAALAAAFEAALPNAEHTRNEPKAQRIAPGGNLNMFDGDPGEPEVLLSPLSYTYQHRIMLEVGAAGGDPGGLLDTLLTAIGEVIEANRTLGGLCSWLDAEAPSPEPLDAPGAEVARWADLVVIATYTTRSPLA